MDTFGYAPRQDRPSGPKLNPGLHSHRKLPGVLMQRPFWQGALRHSSMSNDQNVCFSNTKHGENRWNDDKEMKETTHTYAMALVGSNPEAGVADAFEGAFHVHALSVLAHPARGTLVHVHAKRVVSRGSESRLANAVVRARCVLASAVQTDPRILGALVDIYPSTICRKLIF